MPAKIEVRNASGVLQFDQDTLNYVVRQSGTVTCSTTWTTGGVTKYTTTIVYTSASYPMLAIASTSAVVHDETTVSGSTWTFKISSRTSGASVNYWVFDKATTSAASSGIRLYDASSNLIYETGKSVLRVNAVITGTGSGTYTSGRTYAVIQGASGWQWSEANLGGGTIRYRAWYTSLKVVSNVVTVAILNFENYTFAGSLSTPSSYVPTPPKFIIVDVTNL
jgi:hypothetical protein